MKDDEFFDASFLGHASGLLGCQVIPDIGVVGLLTPVGGIHNRKISASCAKAVIFFLFSSS